MYIQNKHYKIDSHVPNSKDASVTFLSHFSTISLLVFHHIHWFWLYFREKLTLFQMHCVTADPTSLIPIYIWLEWNKTELGVFVHGHKHH